MDTPILILPSIYRIDSKKLGVCCYVGQSINPKARWAQHKNNTARIKTHIKKYGVKDLTFSIIAYVGIDNLHIREAYYIQLLKPLYNKNAAAKNMLHSDNVRKRKLAFIRQLIKDRNNIKALHEEVLRQRTKRALAHIPEPDPSRIGNAAESFKATQRFKEAMKIYNEINKPFKNYEDEDFQ